jgi:hypothetical protein
VTRFESTVESSHVVRLYRQLADESRICAAVRLASIRLRAIGQQVAATRATRRPDVDLEPVKVAAVCADSRVLHATNLLLTAPVAAAGNARAFQIVQRIVTGQNLDTRIRLGVVGAISAVLAHWMAMVVVGAPGGPIALTIRVALLTAGAGAWWRPGALAAAWEHRAG